MSHGLSNSKLLWLEWHLWRLVALCRLETPNTILGRSAGRRLCNRTDSLVNCKKNGDSVWPPAATTQKEQFMREASVKQVTTALLVFVIISVSARGFAAGSEEKQALRNEDISVMVTEKFDEQTIIKAIESSPAAYDTS